MEKTAPILNLQNYTTQGNLAVDMIANAIIHERSFGKNPDVISLNTAYFIIFKGWVVEHYGHETANKLFFIDGVYIQHGGQNQKEILQIHYYQEA